MIFGHFCGHMPFEGGSSLDYNDFTFDCASRVFIVSICLKFITTVEFVIVSYQLLSDGFSFDDSLFFILNGGGLFISLHLIILGSNWGDEMKFWTESERVFTSNLYHGRRHFAKFKRKIILLAVCIMGYAICEFYLDN